MAKISRTVTKNATFDLNKTFLYYYQFLFSIRANWIKHKIPVSFLDERTGFLLEGYLGVIKNIPEEEFYNTFVEVTLANLPTQFPEVFSVCAAYIFPSNRKLVKALGVKIHKNPGFKCSTSSDSTLLKNLLEAYPGISWTMNEITTAFNKATITDEEILNQNLLVYNNDRNCIISGTLEKSYIMTPDLVKNKVRDSISGLKEAYTDCKACSLGIQRAARSCKVVFGKGNSKNPSVFIIGEAPGLQEETNSEPFFPTAPAGSVLYKVLSAAEIDISKLWFTNSVLCRPESITKGVENSKPTEDSINICSARLKNELFLINPKIVVLLGNIAYRAFYGKAIIGGILSNTGWIKSNPNLLVYAMPHPSYVARKLTSPHLEEVTKIKESYLSYWKEIKNAIN